MTSLQVRPSICRICNVNCPVLVEIRDGRVASVAGDRSNEITGGYTCVKGRAQSELYDHPTRLMHTMKRGRDGDFQRIPVEQAMDEIALRLRTILDRHGPRSVAVYFGTMGWGNPATSSVMNAFADAIGSPMRFNPNTIDKPGKRIARAMLGSWMAPTIGYDEPNVGLLVGLNPFVSYQGLPKTNPGKWLSEAQARGFKLLVIDPRRSDAARRAFVHLQPRPGQDVAILAGMLRVILEEGRYDRAFVREHVSGLEELRRAVASFTPEVVAARADIPLADLVLAARTFGDAGRGYAFAGTGPNFTAEGTLVEYLTLCLITVCGYYLRGGDRILNPRVFTKPLEAIAHASPPRPAYGFGERMRVRDLTNTAAGMPTAALPDEILLPGEGQVRALISDAGNPVAAFPDQIKTVEAMRDLELLVQIDPWMSATAQLADYVIAPTFGFEIPGVNIVHDFDADWGTAGYGRVEAYGQYTPALVEAPTGSDLIQDWEFFYGVAQRMDLALVLTSRGLEALDEPLPLDMDVRPTTDHLIELLTDGSRIPLAEVKRHPRGAAFPDPEVFVAAGDPEHPGRLDVGNVDMMRDLDAAKSSSEVDVDDSFDLRLIPRRVTHVMNSSGNFAAANRGRYHNPAFMHPDDLTRRGLIAGELVRIVSARASIIGEVRPDPNLRPGLVSMSHCFGDAEAVDELRYREIGSSTARLLSLDARFDRYSGQPMMGNIPVRVDALPGVSTARSPEPS